MSITGSLYSGVSGLKAQSSAIGTISDNISNSNTTGYKGVNAQFETLVTNALGRTSYTPGGVLPRPIQGIDRQGLLQSSSSTTDVGIAGKGFFLVSNQLTSTGSLTSSASRAFTRAGSFQIDKQGNMVNTAGYYLLGVPTDTKGNPTTSNPALSAVTPVNVGTMTGIASPTKNLSFGANLPAVPGAPSSFKVSGVLNGLSSVDDTNRYVVTNSKGNAYEIRLRYTNTSTSSVTSYNMQVISVLPVGTSPALDSSKTPTPASLGTITFSGATAAISGGTGLTFTDGATFQPAINVSALAYSASSINQLARAGVDSQDITSVVYDSLGVASNLTVQLDRATDLNRALPSGVTNSLVLSGRMTDSAAYVANNAALVANSSFNSDTTTYTILNSNGDAYTATFSYANTALNTWALRLESLAPIGDAVAPNAIVTPLVLGSLAVTPTGSTFTSAGASITFPASGTKPAATLPFTSSTLPTSSLTNLVLSRSGTNAFNFTGTTLADAAVVGTSVALPNTTVTNSVGFQYTQSAVLVKTQDGGTGGPDVWEMRITGLTALTAADPAPSPAPSTTNFVTAGTFQVYTTPTAATYSTTNASISFTGGTKAGSLSYPSSVINPGAVAATALQLTAASVGALANATTITAVASTGPSPIGITSSGTVAAPVQNQWLASISSMTLVATGAQAIVFPTSTGAQRLPIYLDGTANISGTTLSATTISASLVKFNTDGTLAAGAPTRFPTLAMTTGAADFGGASFTLNLGTANTAGGLTQFTNQFAVSFLSQDGVPFGFRTGVTIDEIGLVRAVFDNGTSVPLFKIPLVNFASINYLTPLSGNTYQVSNQSGDPVANYAGIGGTGKISPATLEASTVDLSQEFTNLIIAQRSYSANAKTITTADELLQEVIALKR